MILKPAASILQPSPEKNLETAGRKKMLKMVKNERMGGSVPVWEYAKTPSQQVSQRLELAKNHKTEDASFKQALTEYSADLNYDSNAVQEFGFGDLVDMVNPLHHIPVLGTVYRGLTGDEIRPISNVIGGALYGGAIGAAAGLVNTIAEEETGRDLTSNALAMILNDETPTSKSHLHENETPEERLNQVATIKEEDISTIGSALAFADLAHHSKTSAAQPTKAQPESVSYYDDGYVIFDLDKLPGRETITELTIEPEPFYNES